MKIEDKLMLVLDKISQLNRDKYKDKPYIKISKEDMSIIMSGLLLYKLKSILNDSDDDDDDDYDD